MSFKSALRRHWLGKTRAGDSEAVAEQLESLTDTALKNIVRAAMKGDAQASMWLVDRGLIELPRGNTHGKGK